MIRTLLLATISVALLNLPSCQTIEPVGFLGAVDKTIEGEPIINDDPIPEGRPNMHEDREERSGGILQWQVR